jgi:hypothetical protein
MDIILCIISLLPIRNSTTELVCRISPPDTKNIIRGKGLISHNRRPSFRIFSQKIIIFIIIIIKYISKLPKILTSHFNEYGVNQIHLSFLQTISLRYLQSNTPIFFRSSKWMSFKNVFHWSSICTSCSLDRKYATSPLYSHWFISFKTSRINVPHVIPFPYLFRFSYLLVSTVKHDYYVFLHTICHF